MDIGLITLLLFATLFFLLIIGVPVYASLLITALAFTTFLWGPSRLYVSASSMFGSMRSQIFMAIPLFILMGNILTYTKIADELFTALYYWTARIRGGLAMGTVTAGAILAAMCGTIEAGTITVGVMALPAMLKLRYSKYMAVGSVAAGGQLGILIPPSIIAIVYAGVSGVSVGRLYFASLIPGITLALLYIIYIGIRSRIQKELCPIMPKEEVPSLLEKLKALKAVFLPMLIIVLILGGVYSGATTPTEAAGVGAFSAFIVAFVRRRLTFQSIQKALLETFKLLGMIIWMIMCVTVFTNVYNALGAPQLVNKIVSTFPAGGFGVIILMQISIFILGCVMDDFALMFLTTPIYAPIIISMGFDPIWFGVLVMVNIQCAFLTPPYGFNLFYMRAITPPEISTLDIYRSVIPFVCIQVFCLILVMVFPQMALWLPSVIMAR